MPVDVPLPPIWLLGSSGYSAELAATLGTGFSFAHHFAKYDAAEAMRAYREKFRPSQWRVMYRARGWGDGEWKPLEQRVPITWTACYFGGHRPWFVCSVYSGGRYCGRRVALLYGAGELFACRRCYGLAYASQREASYFRDVDKAQKIRIELGGSPNMSEAFPDKPKGMHWQTYERFRRAHDVAEASSITGLMRYIDGQDRRAGARR